MCKPASFRSPAECFTRRWSVLRLHPIILVCIQCNASAERIRLGLIFVGSLKPTFSLPGECSTAGLFRMTLKPISRMLSQLLWEMALFRVRNCTRMYRTMDDGLWMRKLAKTMKRYKRGSRWAAKVVELGSPDLGHETLQGLIKHNGMKQIVLRKNWIF